jgi:N-dimethylarginine dimethylaminohydrolase
MPKVHSFEGEGDCLIFGDVLLCGYHLAPDIQAHEYLSKLTGKRCVSLGITDERLHRLDMCFCRLSEDSALYFNHAFNLNSQQVLKEFLVNSVLVRQDEALNLACNSLVLGKKIITSNKAPQTHSLLKLLGYQVYQMELSEFIKAGGSAKALALTLQGS